MTRISEAVLLFLLNATWQVTLVALLVSASDRVLRPAAARYRHPLWVAALLMSVVLTPSSPLRLAPVTGWLPRPDSVNRDQSSLREFTATKPQLEGGEGAVRPVSGGGTLPWIVMPIVALGRPLALTIAAIYGLLLLYRAGVLWRAWNQTRTIRRSARRVELSPQMAQALAPCQRVLGL